MAAETKTEECDYKCDDTVELLIKSTEDSVKAACRLATLPIKCYAKVLKRFSKAVNKAIDECKLDEKPGKKHGKKPTD